MPIDNLIKNYFKFSTNDEVQKFKKILDDNDALFSYVLNQTKDSIIDVDIYVHKSKLKNFLASFKFRNFYIVETLLTLEDELYFTENKILEQITFNCGISRTIFINLTILVVDNKKPLNSIISNFLFDITNAYYKEKIYENKNKTDRCLIKYIYTIGYNDRDISYYDRKKKLYENNEYGLIIADYIRLNSDKIITNKDEYVIKFILNYMFDIYESIYIKTCNYEDDEDDDDDGNLGFFILSNKLDFLNFFNKYNYSKFIEDLKILLNNKIDIRRLIFNTIKYILNNVFTIKINQLNFDDTRMKLNENIFIKFIYRHNLFAFDHYDYVDLVEYKFSNIIQENIRDYEIELDFYNSINITKKNIDFKDKNGFDLMNQEDINVKKYIKENKENIVLVLNEKNITLITKEDLDTYVSNINDNWLFNCDRDDPEHVIDNPYIQIPTAGGNIFVKYSNLYNLFISTAQIFFLNKKNSIKKSQSFKNTLVGQRMGIANYVSANHCQDGSILGIYDILELRTDDDKSKTKTIKSIKSLREPKIAKSSLFSERKMKSLPNKTF